VFTTSVPADLLRPATGYTGPEPRSEGDFAQAAHAEQVGRLTCNLQLEAVAEILAAPLPQQ
jgi:hypothetical protein